MTPASARTRTSPLAFNALDLATEGHHDVQALAQATELRQLSASATGDVTALAAFADGAILVPDTDEATLEMLVLRGAIVVEGDAYGVGSFISVPEGQAAPELRARGEALIIAYINRGLRAFGPPLTVPAARRTWDDPWEADIPGAHSLFHKKLRLPDFSGDWNASGPSYDGGPGGYVRLVLIAPGGDPRQHTHHECWEEFFLLRGDVLLGDRGRFAAGSYMANPPDHWHAPFASQGGALAVVHTDGPMGIPFAFRDVADGPEVIADYLSGRPLLEEPRHRDG